MQSGFEWGTVSSSCHPLSSPYLRMTLHTEDSILMVVDCYRPFVTADQQLWNFMPTGAKFVKKPPTMCTRSSKSTSKLSSWAWKLL